MNILIIAAAVIVIIAGSFYRQKISSSVQKNAGPSPAVSVPSSTPVQSVTPTEASSAKKPTNSPAPPQTPTPVPRKPDTGSRFPDYPGASVSEQSGTTTVYSSGDSPDAVTSWYESKIKELGLNARSFVKTKTNGNVNNKLSAASSKMDISVSITRAEGDSATRIELTQNYY